MKKIATITIEPDRYYSKSHKDGCKFTSVGLSGHQYGATGPCDTDEEIENSISQYIEWAKREGDKVIIIDKRIKQKTLFND